MLYAEPPDDSRIWNGCEPPELLMKRYFCPRIKYKSGLSAVLTTPLPAKRYAEVPFAVTVYATWISESVGSILIADPLTVSAPTTFAPLLLTVNLVLPPVLTTYESAASKPYCVLVSPAWVT